MLQNWPIRSKLIAILIVPLVALSIFSAIQVRADLRNVGASDQIRVLAEFSIKVNDLVDALQRERYATAAYVGSGYRDRAAEATSVREKVDPAVETYRTAVADLPSGAVADLRTSLDTVATQIDGLAAQRRLIDDREAQNEKNSAFYTAFIEDLLDLDAQVSTGSTSADLVSAAASLVSISRAKEAVQQQAGFVAQILFLRQSNVSVVKLIQSNGGAEDAWLKEFRDNAAPSERDFFDQAVGLTNDQMAQMRDETVFASQMGRVPTVNPVQWLGVTETKIAKMREVERLIAQNLAARSKSIASDSRRSALIGGITVFLVLAVSIGIALLVASPMIRHLRRLRGAALDVAENRLPGAVQRLHQGEQLDLEAEVFPIEIRTRDEIGQVADAFTIVHEVAVRTAVEQAAMRKSIGDTFLNLARRSQALIHRQLRIIDGLERKETDPDELAELFRLDHLATRMRRHAEDLIVLSGSKPARGWRRPVLLKDVVRGAVAEVEDYTRVKVLPVSGSAIGGHAVGDVIHMLAELIENATSFSPPHTPVHVSGHEVSNGCVIEVEDRGLGMTEEEYTEVNKRLSNPPPFDLRTSERLGLFVVSRLAQRHGIQVRLRPSPYGGTLAIVLLPASLLREIGEIAEQPTPAAASQSTAVTPPSADPFGDSLGGSFGGSFSHSADTGELLSVGVSSNGRKGGEGDDRPMDDLPVFPTIRSSWFVSERDRPIPGDDPPDEQLEQRQRGHVEFGSGDPVESGGLALRPSEPVNWDDRLGAPSSEQHLIGDRTWHDAVSGDPGIPTAQKVREPVQQEPETSFTRPRWNDPLDPLTQPPTRLVSPESGGDLFVPRTRAADVPALPSPPAPAPDRAAARTDAGLPKRQRRASLAPELRNGPKNDPSEQQLLAGQRSPEEIRTMMSSFQANFGRGLQDGPDPNGNDDSRKVM